jgi:hypothetical protein
MDKIQLLRFFSFFFFWNWECAKSYKLVYFAEPFQRLDCLQSTNFNAFH